MEIREGDLVMIDGIEFHISRSDDGVISYWNNDVEQSFTDTFPQFIDRAKQAGGIRILPGEGKFESHDMEDNRDVYFETV